MDRWWLRGSIAVLSAALLWVPPHTAQAVSVRGVWHLQQDPIPALATNPAGLFLIGDSLTFDAWATADLAGRINAHGWVVSGFEIHGGLEVWELPPRLEPVIDDVPQTVVIALGMNDLISDVSVRGFRYRVRTLLRVLGDRRIIWLGVHAPEGMDIADRARQFNQAIRRELQTRPVSRFGNWSHLYDRNPAWVHPDDPTGIHLSVAGSRGLTGLMIRRLRALPDLAPTSGRR